MRMILFTAAAMVAMPAIAQNAPAAPPPPEPQTAPAPAAPMAPPPPAGIVMGAPTPVVQPLPDAGAPATGADVPWCTKTVTDHCKERSNARGERLHSTPRPNGR